MASITKIKILRKLGRLAGRNLLASTKIGDRSYTIPLQGELGVDHIYAYEKWMLGLLQYVLNGQKGTFVDVGVNIGQTLLKLKAAFPDKSYIGLEPNPACVNYVNKLIKTNQLKDVKLYPVGLFDTSGILTLNLYQESDSDTSASMIADFRSKPVGQQFVPGFTAADLKFFEEEELACIKIDVEGAELEVMRSLEPVLASKHPDMLMEVLPNYDGENKVRLERQDAIEAILKKHGYRILRVLKSEDELFSKVEEVDSFGKHSNVAWSDYYLTTKTDR